MDHSEDAGVGARHLHIHTGKVIMPRLKKMYVAHFWDRGKKPFNATKVVAVNYRQAQEIAETYADEKWPDRVMKIGIERSKGEVLAND